HGGKVAVHSAGPGKGSEFVLRMPVLREAPAREEARSGQAATVTRSRRVLVVDDNVDAAESLAILLRLWGHDVRITHTGPQALERAEEYQPEIALLDIGLPGLSGYEVARRLRQQPQFAATVLIAVTGYGQESDRRQSADAGFDHHLTKPVNPAYLQQ